MKKLYLYMIFGILLSSCQNETLYESYLESAFDMNETVVIDSTNITISEVFEPDFNQSIYPNEKLVYIYISSTSDLPFTSADLNILLPDDTKKEAYLVDGLDYLVGRTQAERPYVRFSVPIESKEMILIINDSTHIHVVWEKEVS